MNLFEELDTFDILSPIAGKMPIDVDEDGEPKVYYKPDELGISTPWIGTKYIGGRSCSLWTTYFNYYKIIPRGCRKCLKIVVKVESLKELFRVLDLQKSEKIPYDCKCGLEERTYTGNLGKYGAYWYAPLGASLEKAKEVWKAVAKYYPSAILKRGCTEFENFYYPSSTWDSLAEEREWDMIEALLAKLFVEDPRWRKLELFTPKLLEFHIIRKWIYTAFQYGDQTYLGAVEKPFIKKPLTYHDGGEDVGSGSTEAEGFGDNRLDGSANENGGKQAERNSSVIQGLPDD